MADIPKIRFKGFTEPWEQRKLGEVFEQTTNLVSPNEDEIELWSLTVEDGLTPKSERYNREFLVKKDNNFKEVRPGDIVYNPMNMTLGAVGYNGMAKSVAVSGYYTTMITKKGYDAYYINTWLKSPQAILLYKTYATGSLIEKQRVQFPTLSIIPASFPNYDEQTKIGQYFESLDNLITLHQRKCDDTKELKKYMLQKMFPKNGEKFPEIRFKGFTEAWEQRKLESLCDIFTDGDWIEAKDQSNSGIRLIQTGNVGTTKYLDKKNNQKWISEEVFERLHCKEIYPGDILISRLPEPAGRACIVPELATRMVTAVDCTIVRTAKEYDSEYLVQYLSTTMYFKIVNSFLGGGTRQRISRGNLSGIGIHIPKSLDEQKKIGAYFSKIDHLITLHQRKCDTLKELKKYMLQNMFPKKG